MWLAGVAGALSMAGVQLIRAETHLATCHKSMFMPCMSMSVLQLAGVAGLVAGALSMAAGEYIRCASVTAE